MTGFATAIASANAALQGGDAKGALRQLQRALSTGGLTLASLAAADTLAAEIAKASGDEVPRRRVAVLCGALSPSMMIRAIRVALAGHGFAADIHEGGYDAYRLDALDPAGEFYRFKPDLTVLALGWRDAAEIGALPADGAAIDALVTRQVAAFGQLWATLRERTGAPVVQHVFDKPDVLLAGAAERRIAASPWRYLDRLNAALVEASPASVFWLDLDAVATRVGLSNWASARDYFLAKLPFASRVLPAYAAAFAGVHRDLAAKAKKVLVVDLDNTMWGGVIGDDGLDGIQFGPGSAEGEAFQAFARYVKALKERGVTLAVSSKNDPELPRRMFERADMPLRLEDFAAFQCNWEDKASNLRQIAVKLNLGLDSFVFVDDNPAECDLIRQALPEVAVVALPKDPSEAVAHLDGLRLFDLQRLTEADALRAKSYEALREADEMLASAASVEDFLADLDMRADLRLASAADLGRLAQMETRTNQFNCTTRRYGADDLEAFCKRPDAMVVALSLRDRLAQHGTVASAVAIVDGDALRIDNWLMSCRVFSRTVEQFMMGWFVDEARARGLSAIVGEYLPTPRNGVVTELYAKLGFEKSDGEGRLWRLDVDRADEALLRNFIAYEEDRSLSPASAAAA